LHINGDKGRSCSICHNVHGAPGERLMVNTVKFADWTMKMDFRLTDNGARCSTGCHGIKEYDRLIAVENIK
ncbi:MAG: cytochrome C, partial [Bacteroidales bacterium]|nr:cytochrome C [Bacteroidales bacterium]